MLYQPIRIPLTRITKKTKLLVKLCNHFIDQNISFIFSRINSKYENQFRVVAENGECGGLIRVNFDSDNFDGKSSISKANLLISTAFIRKKHLSIKIDGLYLVITME